MLYRNPKHGWLCICLIGTTALSISSIFGQELTPTITSPQKGFLRPTNPNDHFEAGLLCSMPTSDGQLRISPLRQWSHTGLEVRRGQLLVITAAGFVQGCQKPIESWAYGPWGPEGGPWDQNPAIRHCALIGRIIGEDQTREFIVGNDFKLEVPLDGKLQLGVSDVVHYDNSGEFVASISFDGNQVDPLRLDAEQLDAPTENLLSKMHPLNEVELTKADGAVRLGSRREADRPMLVTDQIFKPPVEIQVRARTDSDNIRIYYGHFGWRQLIFNWEVRPDQLRVHDPSTGAIKGIPGRGEVSKNEYHDFVWRIDRRRMQVLVDGEERYDGVGDYSDVISPVGIGPAWGSRIDVGSIVIAPLAPTVFGEPMRETSVHPTQSSSRGKSLDNVP